ncbi:hypothetical protein OSB04_019689 [Centaurea solstitialis]|uniref:F-box domain-containing protein n=1 Tax=Centaurea solstitialis TaxID=347529 RepID=A0AA38WG50_9ASTR|nr:hypothetical protein OSB04_019689 [Centaurea solstitialis]
MDLLHDDTAASMIDRISNLPNEIIYHILSFLDIKYAIQTSALSKKWKHIWTSMPHLNLNSRTFRSAPLFVKFVNDALSHRNRHTEVSAVELSVRGAATQFAAVVTSIVNYAYSHNVRKLTIEWFRLNDEGFRFPQRLFGSHTLKHLVLATHYFDGLGLSLPKSAWEFPALQTLNLSNLHLNDDGDMSLNLFSKCVNLEDLTLHNCYMQGLDSFNVCAPKLRNLTITDPRKFPKVFNVVAPQLQNLTALLCDNLFGFLQLSTEELDSLEKVNLSMGGRLLREKESYASGLLDLFQKLCHAKFLILDDGIIKVYKYRLSYDNIDSLCEFVCILCAKVLSACLDLLSVEPCPFNNLKFLKQKDCIQKMPTEVRKYLLESSPNATFILDIPQANHNIPIYVKYTVHIDPLEKYLSKRKRKMVPQKRSREEVDKGTMAKKYGKID